MLAYNDSIPGSDLARRPRVRISRSKCENDGDMEATVHWHGLRVENRYDGVPFETQAPIPVGGTLHAADPVSRRGRSTGTTRTFARTTASSSACTARRGRTIRSLVLAAGRPVLDAHARRSSRRGPTRSRPSCAAARRITAMGRFGNVMLINGELQFVEQRRESARSSVCTSSTRRKHADLQVRDHRRTDEARRRGQRSIRTRVVRGRRASRPIRTCGRRRALRHRRRRTPRASHSRPHLRPRHDLGTGRVTRSCREHRLTPCAPIPTLTALAKGHRARSRASTRQDAGVLVRDAAALRRRRNETARSPTTRARCTRRSPPRSRGPAPSAG